LRRGRGARVVDRKASRANDGARDRFSRELNRLLAQAIADGVPGKAVQKELGERLRNIPCPSPAKGDSR
jgi:hypothetical protein